MNSRIEQFEIVSYNSVFGLISYSFLLILVIVFSFVLVWYVVAVDESTLVKGRYKRCLNKMIKIVVEFDSTYKGYALSVGLLGVVVIFLNLLGMVPYSYTVTAQLVVCMIFSIGLWLGKLYIGVKREGIELIRVFIREGVPILMWPFFVVLEVVGIVVRLISLGVRLFANMMSGHVLLVVLNSMVINLPLFSVLKLLPLFVMSFLVVLEVSVGFIQGYVVMLLGAMYISDIEMKRKLDLKRIDLNDLSLYLDPFIEKCFKSSYIRRGR